MCLRTIYSFDTCDCRVDHLRICRPHINHTHKQIDNQHCWDYRIDRHDHCDRWCSSRKCISHRCKQAPGTSGTVKEYSFEQENEYKDRTRQEQYKSEDNRFKPGIKVEADIKAEVDVKMETDLDETVRKLMDMSAVKDDGTEPSPVKGPEAKRIYQEAVDREQGVWKQREQEWKKQEKKRKRRAHRKARQPSGRARNTNALSPQPRARNDRRKKSAYKPHNIKQETVDGGRVSMSNHGYLKIKQEPIDDEAVSDGIYGTTGLQKVKEEKFYYPYLSDPFLDGACDDLGYVPENRLSFDELMDGLSGYGDSQNQLFHGKYGGERASSFLPPSEIHWVPINKFSEWQLRDVPSEEELCGQKSSREEVAEEHLEDRKAKDWTKADDLLEKTPFAGEDTFCWRLVMYLPLTMREEHDCRAILHHEKVRRCRDLC